MPENRARWMLSGHASAGGRVIGIFLDDFHVRAGESTLRARAALNHLVDSLLRDDDMVALVRPLDPLHAITFTQDRALIRKVIATFEGHAGDYTPRTEFERDFLSRDPKTAEATRAQVVSAALQSLSKRLGDQQPGRKALIFVAEGFRPAQPRAIVYAANRNSVAFYALDPHPDTSDDEPMLRALAEQTGGAASINDMDLLPAVTRAVADLDHYVVVSFARTGPEDGRFHPVQVRINRPGAQVRTRSGYWAPNAALAAAAAKAAAPRTVVPFRASRSSPYIRPWIGMSRGPDGLTAVTVAWEPGATPPRNQRVASIAVKATANDGSVLFEDRVGAGDVERAVFNAPPGYIALEMELHSSGGITVDTDYRSISVPDLRVTAADIRNAAGAAHASRARFRRDEPDRRRGARRIPNLQPHGTAAHQSPGVWTRRQHSLHHSSTPEPAWHSDARAPDGRGPLASRHCTVRPPPRIARAGRIPGRARGCQHDGSQGRCQGNTLFPCDELSRVMLVLRIPC